ncbi:FCD domain-containing protein [Paracoccus liaowanqingii]|uniref:FCD domain-containing protein n=1 Tax=Paracoccus liaowanqingii TaxID=2560053 RepID=UPI00143DF84A|nr:FCD domain-containing protein [Paracoccus liaowanqingii]
MREALRQLESDGGLDVFGGNRVLCVPIRTPADLVDIHDVRLNLEGFAALHAMDRIRPAELRLIGNTCQLMQRAADARDGAALHATIIRNSGDLPDDLT